MQASIVEVRVHRRGAVREVHCRGALPWVTGHGDVTGPVHVALLLCVVATLSHRMTAVHGKGQALDSMRWLTGTRLTSTSKCRMMRSRSAATAKPSPPSSPPPSWPAP